MRASFLPEIYLYLSIYLQIVLRVRTEGERARSQNDADARVRWNLRDDYLRISARTAAGGHAAGAASVSLTPTNAPSCACFQDDRCSGDAEFGRAP